MIRITLQDGSKYRGTLKDIITQLKLEDYTPYNNVEEYKQNISRRVMIYNGEQLHYDSDATFIKELARVGFIKKIEL